MHSATGTLTATNSLENQLPTQRIDMRALKQGLEKIEAEIGEKDFRKLPQVDQATGIVWSEDGLIVSKEPCTMRNGFVWHLDWADINIFAMTVGEFCRLFGKLARKTRLFDDNSKPVFYRRLADLFVAPSLGNPVLTQLIEQTLRIAQDWDNLFVTNLQRQADAGDPQSQFLLHEILKDKDSPHYNQRVAANLLKKAAYQGYPKACTEFLECLEEGEAGHKLLAHLRSLGVQGNETAYTFWAATVLSDIGKAAEDKSYPELSADAKVKKEVFQLLRRASRNGNSDASWALYVAEKDTAKAAKLMRLAAKQGDIWANYVLACCLMSGSYGQPKNMRKANRAFLNLYRINSGRFPGESEERDFYVWAYTCMEVGAPFPQELSNALDRLRFEPESGGGWRSWSFDLLDALREYTKSGKKDIFKKAIHQAAEDWIWEGSLDGDNSEPVRADFFDAGHLDLERNLLTLVPHESGQCNFPRIMAKLRAIATDGVHEAQYILGLMGDTTDDWLGRASDGDFSSKNGFSLASYHLGLSRYANEPEAALRHLERVVFQADENLKNAPVGIKVWSRKYDETRDIVSEEFFHELQDKARARIRKIDAQLTEEKVRRQTERDMLSFLSHTLTSATTGASGKLRKIAGELANARPGMDLLAYASRLAPTATNIAMVESLVEVFKLYTSDPAALRESWARDSGGSDNVAQICALAIRQALLRFYFLREYEDAFGRLMPDADYVAVSHEFMTDVMALDMNTPEQMGTFFDWIRQRLPFLRISLTGLENLFLTQGGPRAIVIFALTGEALGNALKYASGSDPISLELQTQPGGLELTCTNATDPASPSTPTGGKTGLSFIRHVCKLIGATFDEPIAENNVFRLRVLLPMK